MNLKKHASKIGAVCLFLATPAGLLAQQALSSSAVVDESGSLHASTNTVSPVEMPNTNVKATPAPTLLGRWLAIDTLSSSLRYRSTSNIYGIHMFDFGQHRELLDGHFKLDRDGNYSIYFHGSSGRYFNWAYADTIGGQFTDDVPSAIASLKPADFAALIASLQTDPDGLTYARGIASRGGYFYLRQLYFSATPVQKVTLEFGSLPIEHGVNTEITSFDDDGYIDGERLRFHDAKDLYFDEVDFTSAYLGDPFVPNFFSRGARLRQANYQQFLVKKKLNSRVVASADYTRLRATHTSREAVEVTLPKTAWLNSARGEFYQRVNDVHLYGVRAPAGSGFSVDVSKTFKGQVQTDIGYASIDNAYAAYSGSSFLLAVKLAWNSDSLMNGNHPYARVNWKLAPGLALVGFYTHDVSNVYAISGQTIEAGFNYDLADLLHKERIF